MKVSVIVPVYNSEKELKTCLNSLVNQTLDDMEIIIIDDNSSDNSRNIILDYKRVYPNIKTILANEHLGQGRARNYGIELASGDYIAFLDSDDYVSKYMYENLYQAITSTNSDIAITGIAFVKDDHLNNEKNYYNDKTNKVDIPIIQKDVILNNSPSACNKLFKRDLICNYHFLEDCIWEDICFTYSRLMEAKKIVSINTMEYYYRLDLSSGVSSKGYFVTSPLDDIFRVNQELTDEMESKGLYDEFEPIIRTIQFAYSLKRIEEIDEWNADRKIKKEKRNEMFDKIYEHYGTLDGINQIELQTRSSYFLVEEYNKRYPIEEKIKHR